MSLTRKVTRVFFCVAGGLSLSIGSLNSQCSAQLGLAVSQGIGLLTAQPGMSQVVSSGRALQHSIKPPETSTTGWR